MEPDEMVPMWKILHLAGADWTYSTEGWAAENYCMFARDLKGWEHIVRAKAKAVENLGCKVWLNTECAHEMYAFRTGLKRFNIPHNFEVKSIVQYYAQWIREGKLKVNSEWNRALSIKFTFHDPCQLVRKSFGDPVAEDLRYVVRTVVGERNFIDMTPSRSLNYCCGGGGGYLQSGFTEARYKFGAKKFNQIKATGADYCITACHNCHTQIRDLNEHYKGGYHTIHLWTIICLALGCLGENERRYLGPDLVEEGL
jgi:Fe-S oxidoreductase